MDYSDIVLELAYIEREALRRIAEKMASRQLGEAWTDLVDERRTDEGDFRLAA